MLICIYTVTQPGALVYVKRNVKVVTKCALKNYNEDRDIEAGKSNSKDSSEDDNKDDNKDDRKDKEFQNKMDVDLDEPVKTLCYKHVTFILL